VPWLDTEPSRDDERWFGTRRIAVVTSAGDSEQRHRGCERENLAAVILGSCVLVAYLATFSRS
jgi:hypothetical protein